MMHIHYLSETSRFNHSVGKGPELSYQETLKLVTDKAEEQKQKMRIQVLEKISKKCVRFEPVNSEVSAVLSSDRDIEEPEELDEKKVVK